MEKCLSEELSLKLMTKSSEVISKHKKCFSFIKNNFQAYFSQYGEVEEVIRPINKEKGENKPFCFVTFKKDGIMGKCVKGEFLKFRIS